MDELVAKVCAAVGLDEATAQQAIGTILSLVRSNGDSDKVAAMFDAIPGAAEFADAHGDGGDGSGGLLGKIGGALGGSIGAPMEAIGKLQSAGLDMDQIKQTGQTVLDFASEQAGEDTVKQVMNSIPGLSKFI